MKCRFFYSLISLMLLVFVSPVYSIESVDNDASTGNSTLTAQGSANADIINREFYNSTPGPEGDYANITANTLWVSGVLSALPDLFSTPSRLEDLKPLYIPKEIRVTNELLKPYSAKTYDQMSNFIMFRSDKVEFRFDNHSLSGGLFFQNSFNGLVFNNDVNAFSEPISLRSRGKIYLQPGASSTVNSSLGTDDAPNWRFVDNAGSGTVHLLGDKVSIPRVRFSSTDNVWSISSEASIGQNSTKPAFKNDLYIRTDDRATSGLIIEDDVDKTLMSIRDSDGAIYISGDLDITGTYAVQNNQQLVPPGLIVGFIGNTPPSGNEWVVCNGQVVNGVPTPDMVDSFFRSAPAGVSTLVDGTNRHPSFGDDTHQHWISRPQFNYSIDHDHNSVNGFVPMKWTSLSGGMTSTQGIYNAGSSTMDRNFTKFNFDGNQYHSGWASTATPQWRALPILHGHLMGTSGRKVVYDLPMYSGEVKTAPASRSLSRGSSGAEEELPAFARVIFLMKT